MTGATSRLRIRTTRLSFCTDTHQYATEGTYTITVSTNDGDGGTDSESVTIEVVDDSRPDPKAGSDILDAVEGTGKQLHGSVTDDGDAIIWWSAAPIADVDLPGAFCAFEPSDAEDAVVTCNDDGSWRLTLHADDPLHEEVTDDLDLTVLNANPTAEIDEPTAADPPKVGVKTNLVATLKDDGTNDVNAGLLCSIAWGAEAVTDGVVIGTECTGEHTFPRPPDRPRSGSRSRTTTVGSRPRTSS